MAAHDSCGEQEVVHHSDLPGMSQKHVLGAVHEDSEMR